MSERIKIIVDDDELRAILPLLDELLFKKALVMGDFEELENVRSVADAVEASVEATVDRLTAEITAVRVEAAHLEDELEDLGPLRLPGIDRATRLILLRIPGLREVVQMMYRITLLQRTLKIPGRGEITALIVVAIYLTRTITRMQRRQDRVEAKQRAMEAEINIRMISMEEAVRGYGELPQRYRSTVVS